MWPSPEHPETGTFVKALVDALTREGIENDVLPVEAWRGKRAYVAALPRIRTMVAQGRYEIVHAQYAHCIVMAHLQRRVPVIGQFHGEYIDAGDTGDIPIANLAARLLKHAITVDSETMRRIPTRHKALIPIGVDTELFVPRPSAEAKAILGLDNAKRYILFPSDPARPEKRYDVFRTVMAMIASRCPDVTELILHGYPHERVPDILNAADLLLLTSRAEASPTVIKEALMCNLPIVSTDVGDVAETIAGIRQTCIGKTPDQLAESAVRLLAAPERSDGRKCESRLSIRKTAQDVLRFYEESLRMNAGAQ
jgi:glycosyltransferase involved in cell wall biosynthesis